MELRLIPVTVENWRSLIDLEVTEEQSRFFHYQTTKPNLYSLAQSRFDEKLVPLGIFDGDTPVGMALYTPDMSEEDGDDGRAWLTRIMVDKRHQRKGFGRKAMQLLIERVRAETLCREKRTRTMLGLSYEPENTVAEKLYSELGFVSKGEILHEQKVVWVEITPG